MFKEFYTLRNDAVFHNTFYRHPEIMKKWLQKILKLVGEDSKLKEFKIKNCELTKNRLYIKNRNFIYLISALTHNIHIKDNYDNIKMLNNGLDKKTISKCTGLSIKEIDKVAV